MLSRAKNVAGTLETLYITPRYQCQNVVLKQSRHNIPANRRCSIASEGSAHVPCTCSRHREGAINERRVDGTISVDVEADWRRRQTFTSLDFRNVGILHVGIAPVGIGTASRVCQRCQVRYAGLPAGALITTRQSSIDKTPQITRTWPIFNDVSMSTI